ncbi:hypothetical protein TPENAI_60829 [Tenacibaculum litopenaei]|uniref:hypothetical protein n=1 Tax=Tenacibaculum litopenaei TaxID=396016 RepID=UPI00389435D3
MTSILTIVTDKAIIVLNWVFGYSFGLSSLVLLEGSFTSEDFFHSLLSKPPSKVTVVIGSIYGVVRVLGAVSKEWKQHRLNIQAVQKGQEQVEQEELKTEKQRKELNDDDSDTE